MQQESILAKLIIFLIMIYKKCISPFLGPRCRFYPSCSDYTAQALKKYGLALGAKKSVIRICKCQPFCKGGIDFP
jgi:putative membrane protein insertion efficiency factor